MPPLLYLQHDPKHVSCQAKRTRTHVFFSGSSKPPQATLEVTNKKPRRARWKSIEKSGVPLLYIRFLHLACEYTPQCVGELERDIPRVTPPVKIARSSSSLERKEEHCLLNKNTMLFFIYYSAALSQEDDKSIASYSHQSQHGAPTSNNATPQECLH